jgi:ubiquinone/menaquinone biosynthesis C-methylase UbiE
MTSSYIHGTESDEQHRLERLNQWTNEKCIAAMELKEGDQVIDFGSGLGALTQRMAEVVGCRGCVVGIEQSDRQISVARNRQVTEGAAARLEFRAGSVEEPPLSPDEWGTFDVAHARFVLEHVDVPSRVVQNMVRSVRPGGRIILADDDHPMLRLWPECPGFDTVWTAYQRAFERNGNDSQVGRRLVQLLYEAGAMPARNDWVFFGSCSGSPEWDLAVENLLGVLRSAKQQMIQWELIPSDDLEFAFDSIARWKLRPDVAIWYAMAWAEGVRR